MKSSLQRVGRSMSGTVRPHLFICSLPQEPQVVELLVQLVAADAGQVVSLGIEEEAVEDVPRRLRPARLAGTDQPVDPGRASSSVLQLSLLQGVADDVRLFLQRDDVEADLLDRRLDQVLQLLRGQLLVALEEDLARSRCRRRPRPPPGRSAPAASSIAGRGPSPLPSRRRSRGCPGR